MNFSLKHYVKKVFRGISIMNMPCSIENKTFKIYLPFGITTVIVINWEIDMLMPNAVFVY